MKRFLFGMLCFAVVSTILGVGSVVGQRVFDIYIPTTTSTVFAGVVTIIVLSVIEFRKRKQA